MAESINTIYGNALILPSKNVAAKETWVLNETLDTTELEVSVSFKCNNVSYNSIKRYDNKNKIATKYDTTIVASDTNSWVSQSYRKLTFDTPPTGDLLTWLQANGVKQPDDTAVQDTKALTITSNGTVSVTPDAPYDALKKVDVTVNVASGGGAPSLQSKSITYTANGTATITPDEGYDGLSSVDVTVDVAACDSPLQFFLDHGYIPEVEFTNEAYSEEIRIAVENFTKYTLGEICDSYGFERPYNIDTCYNESSGNPAIIIW